MDSITGKTTVYEYDADGRCIGEEIQSSALGHLPTSSEIQYDDFFVGASYNIIKNYVFYIIERNLNAWFCISSSFCSNICQFGVNNPI